MTKIVKIGKISNEEKEVLKEICNYDILEIPYFYSIKLYSMLQEVGGGGSN
ncbi:hypothetical protein [Helicobacter sp. WB40]|uniref:hypothetical protein n=1 Tax=Helicobacter sp. WB40 TaxID=3004130 RepID=UPI0022EC0CD6|nr:hypothetical protein [Helicobacter sp. WB40]MDA3967993.1 hypothetical protein [Helicobacter sp. WB40]